MILYMISKKDIVKLFSQNTTIMSFLSLMIYISIIFGKDLKWLDYCISF